MAQYKCTNFGNCNKANNQEIITDLGINPSCSECGTTLSSYTPPTSSKWKYYLWITATVLPVVVPLIFWYVQKHQLTVVSSINGSVVLEQDGKKINCDQSCKFSKNSEITLKAQPNQNFKFDLWKGDCKNIKEQECKITMDGDKTVEVVFSPVNPVPPVIVNPTIDNSLKKLEIRGYIREGVTYFNSAKNAKNNEDKQEFLRNAKNEFNSAIKIAKDGCKELGLSPAYYNLASIYSLQGDDDLAVTNYESAINCVSKTEPEGDALPEFYLASHYMSRHKEGMALQHLDKALDHHVNLKMSKRNKYFCDLLNQIFFKNNQSKHDFNTMRGKHDISC